MDRSENECLYDAIEDALGMLRRTTSPKARIQTVRQSFPSPVFFVDSSEFVKEKLGMPHLEAFYFSVIPGLSRYLVQEYYGQRPRLNRLSLMVDYLMQLYRGARKERFYAVLLDHAGRKIDAVLVSKGTTDSALFDLKLLLSMVVQKQARAVTLCHNHPRGTLQPSEEDIHCTLRAMRALTTLGVPMLDHIIIAYNRAVSIRDSGIIPPALWVEQAPHNNLLRNWNDVDLFTDPVEE